jgi:hypothetical protein
VRVVGVGLGRGVTGPLTRAPACTAATSTTLPSATLPSAAAPAPAAASGALGPSSPLAIGRLLTRDGLHPGADAGIAASHAENPAPGLVDDLDLELLFDNPEPVERKLLGFVDRTGSDLNPIHG